MPNLRLCRVEGSGFGVYKFGLSWEKIDRDLGSRFFVNFGALNWRTGASETRINHNLRRGHTRNERRSIIIHLLSTQRLLAEKL